MRLWKSWRIIGASASVDGEATLAMCSGCSGAFDGDGEDQEIGYGSPFEDGSGWAEGVGGETDSAEQPAPEILPGCSTGMAEEYEVLVSAERIIERRTILAKRHAFSEEGAGDAREAWQEIRTEYKQSDPETAKYYRTQSGYKSDSRQESANGSMRLICLYLGGLAGFALALWLALGCSL